MGGYAPRAREDSVRPRRLLGASRRPLNFTVRSQMRGSFLPQLPDWADLLVVASIGVFALVMSGARPRPEARPANYDELRTRYELVTRLTSVFFFLGLLGGFALPLELGLIKVPYGIPVGGAALAATCYLAIAIQTNRDRSWGEYLRYEDLHRGPLLRLPTVAYVWLLFACIIWGAITVALMAFGP